MGGLEAIVAHGAGGRKSDVDERHPSLQLVMPVTVKEIGSADGDTGCCGFDRCESRVIVYNVVRKKYLLFAAAAHVQRRKIVEGARRANACEEPAILFVPASPRTARQWSWQPRAQQEAASRKVGFFASSSFRRGPSFVLEFSYYRS
jgi:hypothetical protein